MKVRLDEIDSHENTSIDDIVSTGGIIAGFNGSGSAGRATWSPWRPAPVAS
jgi:hypothetical protein